ncbi:acyltransferase family protein [Paraburkholderia rhizosphaerae]|uniref:Peptidoglycan/LPS O-acetylase OafA/YrhL n=1 Tax=Paraburkholderia rhizosphaerae TaxID=480658 RepID=A0A4R8M0B1_9BURK|nr:acyltransferase [Paraburkholderia rhizosphaerae]TDY52804.1 peptidoglycan/LPS O-acetylase OafA/YrhL [Paraburkholderia rhizosphaerae]
MSDSVLNANTTSLPFSAARSGDVHATSASKEHVIDAMRGLAALLVAYFHCRQVVWVGMQSFHHAVGTSFSLSSLVAYATFPISWGSAGVPIFFVISGYCIHRGAAFRLARDPNYRLDAGNFWMRRFARIYPVLLAALLLTLTLDAISLQLPPVSHKVRDIGLMPFLVNLFSLQGVAGHTYGSNGALWTLSLEVQFYAIYPLLFALRRRFGMNTILVAVALINIVSGIVLERHDIQFFPSYWFSWTLGAWIAEAQAGATATRQPRSALFWYGLAALLTLAGCAAFYVGQYLAFQLWALGFACYLHKALQRKRAVESAPMRVLSRFGDFSFSLYLIHLPIFVMLSSVFFRSELQLSIWPSFGYMGVAVVAAYVFYRLVELPSMKWSASFKPKSRAKNEAPAARVA